MAPEELKVYLGQGSMLTAYGLGVERTYQAMAAGQSGLRQAKTPQGSEQPLFHTQRVSDADIEPTPGLTRLERMAATTMSDLFRKTAVAPSDPSLIAIVATTKGNIGSLVEPEAEPPRETLLTHTADTLVRAFGLANRPIVVCNACISGLAAAIIAARLIRQHRCRHALVVAVDELTDFVATGFLSFRSVSQGACRPYDAGRDGLSLGEGAAALLLTADPALSAGTCIEGAAMTDDANHISGPSRTGEPLANAIRRALRQTGLGPEDISMVNPHGTATLYNDEMESKAIHLAQLDETPLVSLKPYLGHTLAASGLIELILSAEQLKRKQTLATLGYQTQGTTYRLGVSGEAQVNAGLRLVKTASGFGGCNAAAVIAAQDVARAVPPARAPKLSTLRTVEIGDARLRTSDGLDIDHQGATFADFIRKAYHEICPQDIKFSKMDNLSRLAYVGAQALLQGVDHQPETTAMLLANRHSSLDTDRAYLQAMQDGQPSPAKFVYTLPNVVIGEVCICHNIKGETLFIIEQDKDPARLRQLAAQVLDLSDTKTLIVGWTDLIGEKYQLYLEAISVGQS